MDKTPIFSYPQNMGANAWLCVEEKNLTPGGHSESRQYKMVPEVVSLTFWSSWAEVQLLPASIAKHQLQKRGEMSADNSHNFMR